MKKPSYSEKMKFIKPLVDFDFKKPDRLGRKNKALVTRYFNIIKELRTENRIPVKVRSKGRLEKINDQFLHDFEHQHLRTAWVPARFGNNPKILYPTKKQFAQGRAISLQTRNSNQEFAYFDNEAFVKNTKEELRRVFNSMRKGSRIVPLSSTAELNTYAAADFGSLFNEIKAITNKYPSALAYVPKHGPNAGKVMPGWLTGLRSVKFENQEEMEDFEEGEE